MRLNQDQTVVVETLADIKQVIQEFLPGNGSKNPEVSATMVVDNVKYKLSAPTNCTYHDMLISGFEIIKRRLEAQEKYRGRISDIDPINSDGHMWLDDLITRRLGGIRDGLRVRWQLPNNIYYFDPFTGKLTEVEPDHA